MSGADAKTMPVSKEYEDGYKRVFGDKKPTRGVFVHRCSNCDGVTHAPDARLWTCNRCGQETCGSVDINEAPPLQTESAIHAPIMVDRFYEGAVSPVDGSDIGTRKRHREHMKQHGLTTTDDYKETWAKAEQRRAAIKRGELLPEHRKAVRETIERAIYEKSKP